MVDGKPVNLGLWMVSGSSLRSSLVPTKIRGVLGQWWEISGYHLALTFSKEEGDIIEKQTKKTSVWG